MPKIDFRELFRFVISGGIAAVANVSTVAIVRTYVSFEPALIVGIVIGIILSFVLTKFFAFRSRQVSLAGGELYRFVIVYGFGLAVYWLSAIWVHTLLVSVGAALETAEVFGILFGAGLMAMTSYFGHRFFTYRTGRPSSAR